MNISQEALGRAGLVEPKDEMVEMAKILEIHEGLKKGNYIDDYTRT